MRLLSIDIGIRNLAHCLFDTPNTKAELRIEDWDVVDLTGSAACTCPGKKGPCGKRAATKRGAHFYCKKHVPKVPGAFASKNKQVLEEMCAAFGLEKGDRPAMLASLTAYKTAHLTQPLKSANECSPVELAVALTAEYDARFPFPIEEVVVENQIGPLANRMKALQGMVVQYWVMKGAKVSVVSSGNKLKHLGTGDTTYAERKKMSVQSTRDILAARGMAGVERLNAHKKKDDLADTFLQGMWFWGLL
jgi:hypothetical protein